MKFIFNFASRSRPEKFFKCLDNIHIHIRTEDFIILASLDEDDASMFNGEVKRKLLAYPKVYPVWGHSGNKIHAINRAMLHAPQEWDVVINTSDDMMFVEYGFDKEIEKAFDNDLDQVIHFNDGNQKDNVMTMTIMGRKYYDRFKYIYHPSYKSLWCDCEATEVAWMLGKLKYMGDDKIIFRHLHPAWGFCATDAQYLKTESQELWDVDKRVIGLHRSNNYGLNQEEIKNGFKYKTL